MDDEFYEDDEEIVAEEDLDEDDEFMEEVLNQDDESESDNEQESVDEEETVSEEAVVAVNISIKRCEKRFFSGRKRGERSGCAVRLPKRLHTKLSLVGKIRRHCR